MKVPTLDLKAQYETIRGEVEAAVREVFESQQFILGRWVRELEEAVADYCSCAYAVGVSSGTDALVIALMSEGIQPGDEIITTPYTFFATAGSIARLGAVPVFVDIDPVSFNLDPAKIEAAVTQNTRAIMPVHLFGQTAEMDPIMELADRLNLAVIEDAAQAIGSEYRGRRAGSSGAYGCYSFFPSKNLGGAGDGGMVTTNDPNRGERLVVMRVHGAKPKYHHHVIGGNFRLDSLQAAVLNVKLPRLDEWTSQRQRCAETYRRLFRDAGLVIEPDELNCLRGECRGGDCDLTGRAGVVLPGELPERRHIYNQFVIRSDRRNELQQFLKEREVASAVYYPVPLHLQKCFAHLGYSGGDFPVAECAARQSLALPVYPELSDEMIEYVVSVIAQFHSKD